MGSKAQSELRKTFRAEDYFSIADSALHYLIVSLNKDWHVTEHAKFKINQDALQDLMEIEQNQNESTSINFKKLVYDHRLRNE